MTPHDNGWTRMDPDEPRWTRMNPNEPLMSILFIRFLGVLAWTEHFLKIPLKKKFLGILKKNLEFFSKKNSTRKIFFSQKCSFHAESSRNQIKKIFIKGSFGFIWAHLGPFEFIRCHADSSVSMRVSCGLMRYHAGRCQPLKCDLSKFGAQPTFLNAVYRHPRRGQRRLLWYWTKRLYHNIEYHKLTTNQWRLQQRLLRQLQ